MPKIIITGKGGCGKSTLVTLMSKEIINNHGQVLVVDVDESNLSTGKMMGIEVPEMTLIEYVGGKPKIKKELMEHRIKGKSEALPVFDKKLTFSDLSLECCQWNENMGLIRVGKIEHTMEGCACAMGSVARSFLNELVVEDNQWVLVDTEAGFEHFSRGIPEGADLILMVVDTSYESVLLAEKGKQLAEEAGKAFKVVLNKVNNKTESVLQQELSSHNITIAGSLSYSDDITLNNLVGKSSEIGELKDEISNIVHNIFNSCSLV